MNIKQKVLLSLWCIYTLVVGYNCYDNPWSRFKETSLPEIICWGFVSIAVVGLFHILASKKTQ